MQSPTRQFVWGVIAGIVMLTGSFVLVCQITGVRFDPVVVRSQ